MALTALSSIKTSVTESVYSDLTGLISIIFAPFALAAEGIRFAGATMPVVPIKIKQSAFFVSLNEFVWAGSGIASPKKITSGFKIPSHFLHKGGKTLRSICEILYFALHFKQTTVFKEP